MSQHNQGNKLLQTLWVLVIAILKVIALVFAWCCKICGHVLIKISELTFKLAEK